jgi:hypothetical protein
MDDAITQGRFDVCNGDADGLCAVRQWRLHVPAPAVLVTGLKRDIELLARVPPAQARDVLVCDIAIARNRSALDALLAAGVRVRYFDHHATGGALPQAEGFEAHVDVDPRTCTSLLMDRMLGGRHRDWALVGAYGDNLLEVADALARESGFDDTRRAGLRRLGELINYNAYGDTRADVCLIPEEMLALMMCHGDAAALAREPIFDRLEQQRADDRRRSLSLPAWRVTATTRLTRLPDAPWSRRIVGTLANELANAHPGQAQAVLKVLAGGGYRVSVRAPLARPDGAAALCRVFGGSGRAAAAGIDHLPEDACDTFVAAFEAAWTPLAPAQSRWRHSG